MDKGDRESASVGGIMYGGSCIWRPQKRRNLGPTSWSEVDNMSTAERKKGYDRASYVESFETREYIAPGCTTDKGKYGRGGEGRAFTSLITHLAQG